MKRQTVTGVGLQVLRMMNTSNKWGSLGIIVSELVFGFVIIERGGLVKNTDTVFEMEVGEVKGVMSTQN